MRKTLQTVLLLFLGFRLGVGGADAADPKLVVAVVVDQLRYDYLERFHDHFSTNGFRLLMERGAFIDRKSTRLNSSQ